MPGIMFFDWEGRGPDLTVIGSMNYALDPRTRITLLTYSFDRGEKAKSWLPDLSDLLSPEAWEMVKGLVDSHTEPPPEVIEHVERGGLVCAWNTAFDRTMWQQIATPELGFPPLEIEQTLDAMVQAAASNLPGSLHGAGLAMNLGGKSAGGKGAMMLFANCEEPLPEDEVLWRDYIEYGLRDTELLSRLFHVTRPLSHEEWREYWVSERINDRGVGVDLEVCEGAVRYRQEEADFIASECMRLTDGAIPRPTMTQRINKWVYDILPHDLQDRMVKTRDEDGNPTSLTLAKERLIMLLEDIKQHEAPPDDNVMEFLELLQHGRASSSVKFQKMLDQSVDGRLLGSYVFNGAGQTQRYSSRGIQIHNLPRDKLKNELDLLEMIADGAPIEDIREFGSVNYVLSRLIRPTLIAEEGKTFIWGDWSAIEARVLPWLADTRGARNAVLVPFERGEDLYVLNAARIFSRSAEELMELVLAAERTDELSEEMLLAVKQRQAGKVAVLALGFGGSVGAYRAMARGYGLRTTNKEAKYIVDGWRDGNPWAKTFWYKTLDAAKSAIRNPGVWYPSGKLRYVFNSDLMGGTLLCFMPDGKPLAYPQAKLVEEENKFGQMAEVISYRNKSARHTLWYGILVENPVQGYAASLLRDLLVRLDPYGNAVFHTHDEAGLEVPMREQNYWVAKLGEMMEDAPAHAEGLPLKADVKSDVWYHK